MDVGSLLIGVQTLLADGNPVDPLNAHASKLFASEHDKFLHVARDMVRKHGLPVSKTGLAGLGREGGGRDGGDRGPSGGGGGTAKREEMRGRELQGPRGEQDHAASATPSIFGGEKNLSGTQAGGRGAKPKAGGGGYRGEDGGTVLNPLFASRRNEDEELVLDDELSCLQQDRFGKVLNEEEALRRIKFEQAAEAAREKYRQKVAAGGYVQPAR